MVRSDMGFVFRSPAFFVLLGMGVRNAGDSAWFVGTGYGSESWPATRLMLQTLQGAFTLKPIIIAIYYGGDLVWRGRARRLHVIVDATAAPDWAHLLLKILAISGVLAASTAVAVLTDMAVQAAKGCVQFKLGAILLWHGLSTLITAVQLAVLSVFVQGLARG